MAASERSTALGFLAGALGGAIGTAALVAFQTGTLKGTEWVEDKIGLGHESSREQKGLANMFERAHKRTAGAVTKAADISLTRSQKQKAPVVTEFAFGILCAGVYGAVAEYIPEVTAGFGSIYGATLFAAASEVVLPAMGYVPNPQDRTATQHVGGLTGNMVYGVVTEGVRRLLR